MKNPLDAIFQRVRSSRWPWKMSLLALAVLICLLAPGRLFHRPTGPALITVPEPIDQEWDRVSDEEPSTKIEQAPAGAKNGLDDAGVGNTRLQSNPIAPAKRIPVSPQASGRGDSPNPMIAQAAELTVATKEFQQARTSLEEVLERHRGYAARLRMVGQRNGSVLSAILRVPSTELGGTIGDLKSLGDVEREEQSADEVTQQHADIEARLLNTQNTLHRLQELLKKQTYPDGNVRELQRQIANISAEVNRLEGERQASERRVVFANLKFTLRETISPPTETLGGQIRSAAATGFGDAAASLSALLVFLIGRGPAVALWALLLFLPARLIWRKLAQAATSSSTAAHAD